MKKGLLTTVLSIRDWKQDQDLITALTYDINGMKDEGPFNARSKFIQGLVIVADWIADGSTTAEEMGDLLDMDLKVVPNVQRPGQRTRDELMFTYNDKTLFIPMVYPDAPKEKVYSIFRKLWNHSPMHFPPFSDTRIMMMPVKISHLDGIPEQYWRFMEQLFGMAEERFHGEIGYLTIDERELQPGETLRRAGLHVDGYYQGRCGAWGGGGGWGSVGNGMLTVSSTAHCQAWLGVAEGNIGMEGEADKMDLSKCSPVLFGAGDVYWVDGACIHESMPVEETTKRQFVRLSMPNNGPWFEGYTENPTGIKPSNDTLPARDKFMKG